MLQCGYLLYVCMLQCVYLFYACILQCGYLTIRRSLSITLSRGRRRQNGRMLCISPSLWLVFCIWCVPSSYMPPSQITYLVSTTHNLAHNFRDDVLCDNRPHKLSHHAFDENKPEHLAYHTQSTHTNYRPSHICNISTQTCGEHELTSPIRPVYIHIKCIQWYRPRQTHTPIYT